MANPSIFQSLVGRFWPQLGSIVEKVNDKRNGAKKLTYLHKTMLRKEYSPDQKWETASVNTNYVAADQVAFDSPLPLKARPSMQYKSGRLPKVGIMRQLEESKLNAIDIMQNQGVAWQKIAAKLTEDAVFCSTGIDEVNERAFLEALSNGLVGYPSELTDESGNAQLLRFDFGYLPENTYYATEKNVWNLDDIEKVITDARDRDGNNIRTICIDLSEYNKIRKGDQAKKLVADYNGRVYSSVSDLPVPAATKFDEAFADAYDGVEFLKIDRSVRIERNGVRSAIKPWNANRLVFLTTGKEEEVGALVYGTLAEENHKVNDVDYTTLDGFKLISKFSETNPLREYTGGQALCLCVIENVDEIYVLDNSKSAEVNATAEAADSNDTKITWGSNTYTKSNFITELRKFGVTVANNASDATIIKKVNSLNEKDQAELAANVEQYITT